MKHEIKIITKKNKPFIRSGIIFILLIACVPAFSQLYNEDSLSIVQYGYQNKLTIGDSLSYFIDSTKSIDFPQIQTEKFTVSPAMFLKKLNKNPNKNYYWVRFSFQNNTDTTLHPLMYCGDINYLTLYLTTTKQILQKVPGGSLRNKDLNIYREEKMPLIIPVSIGPRQSGNIFVKMVQKTPEFFFSGVEIYEPSVLESAIDSNYYNNRYNMIWGLLFQGFVLCQILYVLFQWLIIRRKEYLYYFFYLIAILIYFLSKQESLFGEPFIFSRYPLWGMFLNNTLQILAYFFYYHFVKYFLEIKEHYPRLNKWITYIEYFLLAYMAFDFIFIISTFNTVLLNIIFTVIISSVFLITAFFIIYLLKKKQSLIYFVLLGSLAVGLGNILGVLFTFLFFTEHVNLSFSNMLPFAEIGIVIEIICFTSGLSYKNKLIEKEKSISQEKLITQLKENQFLNSKMLNIRNKISLDLHDEIGSTLSSISILSEMALHEKKDTETASMLEEIKQNSISVMERMDDIVWNINPNNDSMEKLFLRIKIFAAKLFEAKGINYKITIDEKVNDINVLMEYRQHIYLIMKEAINNLVKYSDCTNAEINVSYDNNILAIVIKDNGKGYDINTITFGNGLNSMKKRAEEMNAGIEIQSKNNQGTTVQFFVKI